MSNEQLILTKEGKRKLEDELHYLEHEKREEVSKRIKTAREFGDISENSEFDDAKNEQAQVENRISEINNILSNSKVVRKPSKKSESVNVGTKVKINMNGIERNLEIVSGVESDASIGKISHTSPVGASLMGKKIGDKIETEGPKGAKINIKILELTNH